MSFKDRFMEDVEEAKKELNTNEGLFWFTLRLIYYGGLFALIYYGWGNIVGIYFLILWALNK